MLEGRSVTDMEEEQPANLDRSDFLAALLAKDTKQPRDEPVIAANIHEQLQHMGLSTWSLSVLRRIRDAAVRLQPVSILEVGASIGHRSAWLLDAIEREQITPQAYDLVEEGGKFGVILKRLLQRYEGGEWSSVVVGQPLQLAAEQQAWSLASATESAHSQSLLKNAYDLIIVDAPSGARAELVRAFLSMLQPNGVLLTVEPDMPTGDVAPEDEAGMALVTGFNAWIDLVQSTQSTHHVAFAPLFGGTLVGWLPHA